MTGQQLCMWINEQVEMAINENNIRIKELRKTKQKTRQKKDA